MPRKMPPSNRPNHRPKLEIDWAEVDKMLAAHCTGSEIAAHFGMHPDTLYKRCEQEFRVTFTAYSQEKKSHGKALLRLKQYSEAMKGDRGMLIWLGKNLLKQSDKQDVSHSGSSQVMVVNYSDNPQPKWKEKEQDDENPEDMCE